VAFQIATSIPVFQAAKGLRLKNSSAGGIANSAHEIARFRGSAASEDIAWPLVITLIYLTLSWCTFCILYERWFPGRSFLADFPDLILHKAFPSIVVKPLSRVRKDQLKSKLSKMRAGVDAMSVRSNGQDIKEVADQLSSVITDLRDDLVPEGSCVLTGVRLLQRSMDADSYGYILHCIIYFLYGVFTEVYNIFLVIRITYTECHYDSILLMMLYPMVGFPVMFLGFAVLMNLVEENSSAGVASAEPPEVRRISNARPRCGVLRSDPDYLAGLWNLQWEIEDRIVQHVGHPGKLGRDHPEVLSSKANLANILFKRGDFVAAEKVHCQVVEVRSRVLGPEHPDTLTSMEALAADLLGLKDVRGAAKLFQEVLMTRSHTQGTEHPDTLSTKFKLEQCTSRCAVYQVENRALY